jgi:hypothetical protein
VDKVKKKNGEKEEEKNVRKTGRKIPGLAFMLHVAQIICL